MRCERLALPVEISSAPRCTSAATPFTFDTTPAMLSASWLTPRLIASKNPALPFSSIRLLRSPSMTAVSMVCISFSTATSGVRSVHSTTVPIRSPLSLTTGLLMVRKVQAPSCRSWLSEPERLSNIRRC